VKAPRRSLRHSLAQELRARIQRGEWEPGERLPSEPELARQETVSRSSMRAAMTMLEEEGFIRRRRGSGTYVTHRPAPPNDLARNIGVSSLIASAGSRPGTVEEHVAAVPAPEGVAGELGVDVGEPVSSLRRVRTADGRRVVDVTDWCRTDHLTPEELGRIATGSIYAALADRGLSVDHGLARLTPGNADAELGRRLGVPSGTLLLTLDQVDRTADGVAVLVSREHYVADAFTFTLLRRGPGEDGR
jgi:GntR family transcriptional regulator